MLQKLFLMLRVENNEAKMANLKFALHYFDCIILMSFSETAIGTKKSSLKQYQGKC